MAKNKEQKDVEKLYDDENKAKKRWQTADILDKYRDKSRRPKAKKKKKGVLSGYKAMDEYFKEKWKQRDLKKKIKKKKAEGAAIREKKRK